MSIQIIPTLAELVGRPGQTYEAMVPSLFTQEELYLIIDYISIKVAKC